MEINEVLESINLCINTRAKGCSKCRYNESNYCAEDMMLDAVKVIDSLRSTMDAQQQRIAELEEIVVSQRLRADAAESFICKLCAECEWEEQDGITTMQKKCCSWFPECGKFKLAAAEDLRLALVQLEYGCCDTCVYEPLLHDEYPCNKCTHAGGHDSKWEWAKPEVDNGKQ